MKDKKFVLIVRYECGSCAFLTNTCELEVALKEFRKAQEKRFKSSSGFKSFSLPVIVSAELLNLVS